MPNAELFAGALSLLMRHQLTGCTHAASQAASLFDRLSDTPELDEETRCLCDQISMKLADHAPKRCA